MVFVIIFVVFSGPVQATQSATMAWDHSPDPNVVGYFCCYGSTSGNYSIKVNVGNSTSATISGLVEGNTYFFAAIGYSTAGLQSVPSNEIRYTVPIANSPPPTSLTSPLGGTSYTAPATISLAASVTANGHTITKVQFYSGSTLLGEDASSPYSLSWSRVGAGSYSLTAVSVYDAGSTMISLPVIINVSGLPAPWQSVDIGNVGVVGGASVANGLYTVQGAGTLSSSSDNFHFLYQPMSGDGEIAVRLNSVANTSTNACIGVMIRESLTSG